MQETISLLVIPIATDLTLRKPCDLEERITFLVLQEHGCNMTGEQFGLYTYAFCLAASHNIWIYKL